MLISHIKLPETHYLHSWIHAYVHLYIAFMHLFFCNYLFRFIASFTDSCMLDLFSCLILCFFCLLFCLCFLINLFACFLVFLIDYCFSDFSLSLHCLILSFFDSSVSFIDHFSLISLLLLSYLIL